MIIRKRYFESIRPFFSKPLIKVITGVRRCGISTFLEQTVEPLKEKGNIGKLPDSEIDFMAEKNKERIYIQVCTTLKDEKTSRREYKSLQAVPDHYTKLILSLDRGFDASSKGIRWKNISDFLLEY
jgi:uncharacterized protein